MPEDRKTKLTKLTDSMQKRFGKDEWVKPVVMMGSELEPIRFIPTSSPQLSHILGGGWPLGKMIEIFGAEGSGKSSLMVMALRDVMAFDPEHRPVAIIDVEHKLSKEWVANLGLDPAEFVYAEPQTAEDAADMTKLFVESQQFCAVMYDSIGASMRSVMHEEFDEQASMVGGTSSVITRLVQTIGPLADLTGTTIFYANQLRVDMNARHAGVHSTPGGKALKHHVSVRLYLRSGKEKYYAKDEEDKPMQVGFPMLFKVQKHGFAAPFKEAWSDFYFTPSSWLDHVGFDTDKDIQALGIKLGVVKRGGAWYEFGDVKERGREPFFVALKVAGTLQDLYDAVGSRLGGNEVEDVDDLKPEVIGPEIPEDPEI